ncbi:toll/interleukin-1 receptor domain-containing protein [Shewanella sp. 5_MG-2023]|uniref:toll/interleukin-1 receptor domain-containing protein n=1 Tax=unclassified Shewanella TaxID=196818 RepID=UPI000C827515|nr:MULTISPECIES: toll/interleukin-1 receptor domain-containing protein [unclassified Shewanella]MDO6639365.1 toll/interleukin-1 receptor domain-containing protein [Shewanella sp. 5_MG-2023]PMG76252.1 hypothetical protein BCU84_13950 [Shewanella sp. 10N.286.51.B7]
MKKIFVSYSTKDNDAANKIVEGIKLAGHDVWFAPDKILGGDNYAENIEQGIEQSELFVLLASKHAIGNKELKLEGSEEVANEIQLAKKHGLKIVPLKLDNSLIVGASGGNNYHFIRKQWIDVAAALESGDFDSVVEQIVTTADSLTSKSIDEAYIEEAELALLVGDTQQAMDVMALHSFSKSNRSRAEFVKLLAKLLKSGVKGLDIDKANTIATTLQRLRDSDIKPSATYLLAVLNEFCFRKNGFKTSIEPFNLLKDSVKTHETVPLKYRAIIDKLLPHESQFAVEWLM